MVCSPERGTPAAPPLFRARMRRRCSSRCGQPGPKTGASGTARPRRAQEEVGGARRPCPRTGASGKAERTPRRPSGPGPAGRDKPPRARAKRRRQQSVLIAWPTGMLLQRGEATADSGGGRRGPAQLGTPPPRARRRRQRSILTALPEDRRLQEGGTASKVVGGARSSWARCTSPRKEATTAVGADCLAHGHAPPARRGDGGLGRRSAGPGPARHRATPPRARRRRQRSMRTMKGVSPGAFCAMTHRASSVGQEGRAPDASKSSPRAAARRSCCTFDKEGVVGPGWRDAHGAAPARTANPHGPLWHRPWSS